MINPATISDDDIRLLALIKRAMALRYAVLVIKFQDSKPVHAEITEQVKL